MHRFEYSQYERIYYVCDYSEFAKFHSKILNLMQILIRTMMHDNNRNMVIRFEFGENSETRRRFLRMPSWFRPKR